MIQSILAGQKLTPEQMQMQQGQMQQPMAMPQMGMQQPMKLDKFAVTATYLSKDTT